jgi:hypothetical protein
MPQTHHVLGADGVTRIWTEREWTAKGKTCTIDRRRPAHTIAKAHVTLTADSNGWVQVTATWHREPPYDSYDKIARRWYFHDADGDRWSVEYGYDGRYWVLFGPSGRPDGYTLDRTIKGSLIAATEYIARTIARGQDAEVLGARAGG